MGALLYRGIVQFSSLIDSLRCMPGTEDFCSGCIMRPLATRLLFGRAKTSDTCGLPCETGAGVTRRSFLVHWEHGPRSAFKNMELLEPTGFQF